MMQNLGYIKRDYLIKANASSSKLIVLLLLDVRRNQ